MRCKQMLPLRWVLPLVLAGVLLWLAMGAGSDPGRGRASAGARRMILPGTPEFDAKMRAQLAPPSGMADLSLATRENVDFLLTPALLVQEAVSDGVVLTYPEE
ncbi:MAG: hypothetical protein JW993_00615 [Sedimentisphaerales bacterium]|nr:hypothetical protein [Sedimentisphaerales bacterium]